MARLLGRSLRKRSDDSHTLAFAPFWAGEAAGLALLWLVLAPLPVEWAARLSARMVGALGPRLAKHRHLLANVAIAFPEATPEEQRGIARAVWENLGAVIGELPRLGRLLRASERHLALDVDETTRARIEARQPAVFVAAHLASLEILGLAFRRLEVDAVGVYSPQDNPLIERMLQRCRRPLDYQFIGKQQILRRSLALLREGRSIVLYPDQRVDTGEAVSFFGREAATTISPARLALRAGVPLVPVRIERTATTRYRIRFEAPIAPPVDLNERDAAFAMTEALHRRFEHWIRAQPGQWLSLKRRWPKPGKPLLTAKSARD